jgi:hypothetical protein
MRLPRQGCRVNHKRVLRMMREESGHGHLKKRFVIATTNSPHRFAIYPNVLAGTVLTAPDQARARGSDLYSLAQCVCGSGLYSRCLFPSLCGLASLS